MRRASISTLKAKLSQYLDAVRRGEEILVTDRGTPVARLSPVSGDAEQDSRRNVLVRTGRLRPPQAPLPAGFWTRPRPRDAQGQALAALLETRKEGR
ncbi:MAG TPA: type II toxin-antitoxin system prevent-host-death family antitoxin [Gemmatimonadales bacterium]